MSNYFPEALNIRGKARRLILHGADAVSRRLAYDRTVAVLENGTLSFDDYRYSPQPRFGTAAPPLPWLVTRLQAQSDRLVACGRPPESGDDLASQPTMVDLWCSNHRRAPDAITLDIDDTADIACTAISVHSWCRQTLT